MAFGTVSVTDPEMCTEFPLFSVIFNPPHPNRDMASPENMSLSAGKRGTRSRRLRTLRCWGKCLMFGSILRLEFKLEIKKRGNRTLVVIGEAGKRISVDGLMMKRGKAGIVTTVKADNKPIKISSLVTSR